MSEEIESTPTEGESVAATNWHSEDYSELIEAKGFKSADDVLKSYKNLEAMQGNSVRIPPVDASPEAKQDFLDKIKDVDGILLANDEALFDKLGRPESADGYKLDDVLQADVVNHVPGIDQELTDFKTIAHEIGLSDAQAAKLVEMRITALTSQQQHVDATREQAETTLRKNWGADFDARLAGAKETMTIFQQKYDSTNDDGSFSGPVTDLINGPAGNNPVFLELVNELAQSYKEKGHEGVSKIEYGDTPETATRKIAEKRADRGFMEAYKDKMNPNHRAAVAELQGLYKLQSGGII